MTVLCVRISVRKTGTASATLEHFSSHLSRVGNQHRSHAHVIRAQYCDGMLLQKPIQCNAAQSRRINALPVLHSSQLRCNIASRLARLDTGLQRRVVGAAATAAHKGAQRMTL